MILNIFGFTFFVFYNIVSITSHCPDSTNSCKSDTCYNGGICHEGWNRVVCDCSNTEYAGATCMKGNIKYNISLLCLFKFIYLYRY